MNGQASSATLTDLQREALDVARALADAGVPVFCAYPDGRESSGYRLPSNWQHTQAHASYVDAWRPGMALCAVMGQGLDLLDFDTYAGGDLHALDDVVPQIIATAATPSGGVHGFVRSLGIRSRDGFLPHIDFKGGDGGGNGRGFAFIAPTVRWPKGGGDPQPYCWIHPPDVALLLEPDADDDGSAVAEIIEAARNAPAQRLVGEGPDGATIPSGVRNATLTSLAGSMRRRGMGDAAIEAALLAENAERCDPPLEYREVCAIALSVARYAPSDNVGMVTVEVDGIEADVTRELHVLRVREEARRRFGREHRPESLPAILTLAERLSVQRPATEYRIEGWQPLGSRVVLAAQFKSGKTTLTGNLARSLVDGQPFLDVAEVRALTGTLAIIDTEMSEALSEGWLRDQVIERAEAVLLVPLRGHLGSFDILDPEVRGEWAARLRDQHVEYLVLDCLRPLMDALGLDENRDAGRVLVALDALLAEAGITDCLVVHHMGHTQERSRGDSRIRDWPDVEWRLVREKDEPASARFITAFGRDVEVPEGRLHFDSLTRRLTLSAGSRGDAAALEALSSVMATLAHGGEPQSKRQIEQALADTEHPRKAIRQALSLGVKDGVLTTSPGPRGAILFQCASSPELAVSSPAQSSQFAAASISGALASSLDADLLRRTEETESSPSELGDFDCPGCGAGLPVNRDPMCCMRCGWEPTAAHARAVGALRS